MAKYVQHFVLNILQRMRKAHPLQNHGDDLLGPNCVLWQWLLASCKQAEVYEDMQNTQEQNKATEGRSEKHDDTQKKREANKKSPRPQAVFWRGQK